VKEIECCMKITCGKQCVLHEYCL